MNLLTKTVHLWVSVSLCALDWVCIKVGGPTNSQTKLNPPSIGWIYFKNQ